MPSTNGHGPKRAILYCSHAPLRALAGGQEGRRVLADVVVEEPPPKLRCARPHLSAAPVALV